MTVSDFNIQQRLIASAEEALDLAVMAYEFRHANDSLSSKARCKQS